MQIVIELSESDFEDVKKHSGSYSFGEAIKNGVVLPRWHGRLIDADEVTRDCLKHTGKRSLIIDLAPTVIEADVTDMNVGKKEEDEQIPGQTNIFDHLGENNGKD